MWRHILSVLLCGVAGEMASASVDSYPALDRTAAGARRPLSDSVAAGPPLDRFGIAILNPSLNTVRDWVADWEQPRTFTRAEQRDGRTMMKGKGTLQAGGGEIVFDGDTPRLYIEAAPDRHGVPGDEPAWMNTEFTAYARVEAWGDETAGFTLISRTNHDTSDLNPCDAHGYYTRVVFSSGLVYIKKEFRHSDTDGVVYSKAVYSNDGESKTSVFDFDFVNQFLGIKAIVHDNPDGRSVNLQVYLDLTEGRDGGDWQLAIEYDDYNLSATTASGCQYSYTPPRVRHDQCPVLRPGRVAILRSDMVNGLHWKWASVREIDPIPAEAA